MEAKFIQVHSNIPFFHTRSLTLRHLGNQQYVQRWRILLCGQWRSNPLPAVLQAKRHCRWRVVARVQVLLFLRARLIRLRFRHLGGTPLNQCSSGTKSCRRISSILDFTIGSCPSSKSASMLDRSFFTLTLPAQGYYTVQPCLLNGFDACVTLISRRSRHRSGTRSLPSPLTFVFAHLLSRYKRRGIDENGYTANFVETEQILSSGPISLAFVIVRGLNAPNESSSSLFVFLHCTFITIVSLK